MIDYRLELVCTTFPYKSRTTSYEKGGLHTGAVLKHCPLQILYKKVCVLVVCYGCSALLVAIRSLMKICTRPDLVF